MGIFTQGVTLGYVLLPLRGVLLKLLTHPLYGLIKAKRPARAKALIINAFALTGRIVICDIFTQGAALGYTLLPLRGALLVLMTRP